MEEVWHDMKSAPLDGEPFSAKLSNGREVWAEWWSGPPGREEAWGGWGICMTQSFVEGTISDDCAAQMIGWRRPAAMIDAASAIRATPVSEEG